MNEAEKSNNNPSLFESIPQSVSEPVERDPLAEEWTTDEYPNALPINENPPREPVTSDSDNSRQLSDRIDELDQQNQALRRQKDDLISVLEKQDQEFHAQIANLNKALQQTRNMLRLERRNWESQSRQIKQRSHEQTAHITQQTQELTTTQEQVVKLFRELEHAQQTAQRQQILVETLTHQLEASQEQVAQLERECAHTQQRYSDQTQLVHQTENSCKDLRSRLLRQQRYTMQFKAALEKCLDVPVANDSFDLPLETGASVVRQDIFSPASDLLAPKAQPVQPWSAQPEFPEDPLLEPLSAYVPSPWDEDSQLEEPEQIFSSQDFDSISTEAIVDEPFDSLIVEPLIVSYTIQRSPESEASLPEIQLFTPDQTAITEETSEEPEWAVVDPAALEIESDLEQKFDDALQALEDPVELSVSNSDLATLQADQEILNEIHAIEEFTDPAPELDLFEPETTDPMPNLVQSSSPFITLRSTTTHDLDLQSELEREAPLLANGPSPIVYPLRSSKKLKSLAAVDLPSFPRPSR
ncbi:MAG: hypothetical protein LH660_14915 [Phormidesmis sp. CAN_BIN36]|nr:hypothetical protein [Phormidesmis sp. CAN_BIN36]